MFIGNLMFLDRLESALLTLLFGHACIYLLRVLNLSMLISFCLCFLGLTAKVIDRTNTMADVYGGFYDFSSMLKSKV